MNSESEDIASVREARRYTTKQMADACEMLVAAELTLNGIPSLKVPDCWPGYDVVAQPPAHPNALRVSVKSRTFKLGTNTYVTYNRKDQFDWLAVVLLPGAGVRERRIYLVPKELADQHARKDKVTSKTADERYWSQQEFARRFAAFERNFTLRTDLVVTA